MSAPAIQVSETLAQASLRAERAKSGKPIHWVHDTPTLFQNPWPSFRKTWNDRKDFLETVSTAPQVIFHSPSKKSIAQIPIQKPTWGGEAKTVAENTHKIKATWLGHACFLVELPSSTAGVRGARILFDPVFSDRCSPSQRIGPKRFTPPPCALEDVTEIDVIVISHNHYDHMDTGSLTSLLGRSRAPHIFVPIGDANSTYVRSLGVPATRTHCLDWWDARRVTANVSPTQQVVFDITFTPGQHFSGRSLCDHFQTLWGGWVVEGVSDAARVYFGGDTGYRSVPSSKDDGPDTLPVCPAFKEIGERFQGGFDFAMIPIGAYAPRRYMSPIHCSPRDSVAIYRDIKARRALGMHWGTWVLTPEDILEPPVLLAEECTKAGIKAGAFGVCAIGETVTVDVAESA